MNLMDCVLGVCTLITRMKARQNGTKYANTIEVLKDLAIVLVIRINIGDKYW